jgi:hypothetical protein
MLGFLGNITCCVTMGLLRFLSNATVPVAQQWVLLRFLSNATIKTDVTMVMAL